ncbi:hypothetical protein R3P38DRAFT_2902469 [Favolaschia claudopus]|uniref:EthD domain-containing protein n=1 Tax=Favolaschia claudopus TaxID=2862362 RepID=A0AAV9ZI31_9AGAR
MSTEVRRTDRPVRAVGVFKSRHDFHRPALEAGSAEVLAVVKNTPGIINNITSYEVYNKIEPFESTLAGELKLKEAEMTTFVWVEGESLEKIREALTQPEYLKVVARMLNEVTTFDDFHFFTVERVEVGSTDLKA